MAETLYNILISPLVIMMEFFYELIYEITDNEGLAVIALSFVVTLVTMPLYMIAESYSEIERKAQERFKPQVQRIKSTFKGDEQYMILNAFYRENHYHPLYALRSSISLLIQVPFFMAAYTFLSNLQSLHGYSFLFIKDFGLPDAVFKLSGFSVNILPIAMTLINCLAGAIYSKGHALAEKIQIYVLALVFLAVLYDSPSGLVVYWTMNNILSLVKNVFYKIKNPKKVLYILLCLFSAFSLISSFTILSSINLKIRLCLVVFAILLPFIPFALIIISRYFDSHFKFLDENKALLNLLFFMPALSIALLAGFVIPSMLVDSEPVNYCYVHPYSSPFSFIWTTFFKSLGLFLVWPGTFYLLFTSKIKKIFAFLFCLLASSALLNTFAFSGNYGPIEATLLFMEPQDFIPAFTSFLLNFVLLLSVFVFVFLLFSKFPKAVNSIFIIMTFSLLAVSFKNSLSIQGAFSKMEAPKKQEKLSPVFELSSTGKNVLFIMLDKCYSPFFPYIFDEFPQLKEKFNGFINYPNTVSMGTRTMVGVPGLYGGYDFTPYQINKRTEESLQKKHNEALLTLPLIFGQNGFKVQLTGLPYENFLEYPTSKMYENYPFIQRLDIYGPYSDYWYDEHHMDKPIMQSQRIKRNFILFSIFKMVPPILRDFVYHNEYWTSFDEYDKRENFINQYSALDYLPELTKFNQDKGSFIIIDNECTHETIFLEKPDFEPSEKTKTDNIDPNNYFEKDTAYSTTCGVFFRLAEFFDYLRENNVYDNTKIIIVSDHGKDDYSPASSAFTYDKMPFMATDFVATLMLKDFDSHGEIINDMTFMTNADSPALATEKLIENAKNPFTGHDLKVKNKEDYVILHAGPAQDTRSRHDSKYLASDDQWFTVKDNIFLEENWGRYIKN